jgi:hypothetical protein
VLVIIFLAIVFLIFFLVDFFGFLFCGDGLYGNGNVEVFFFLQIFLISVVRHLPIPHDVRIVTTIILLMFLILQQL